MARAIKVSIYDPSSRTTMVKYIEKKHLIGPTAFRLPKTDEVYFMDPNYSMTTTTKRMGVPFRYTTYYYKRNIPKPIDLPNLSGGSKLIQIKNDETNELISTIPTKTEGLVALPLLQYIEQRRKNGEVFMAELPIQVPTFNDWSYTGITAKELGQLLNPAFFTMIARANKDKRADLMFYLSVGNILGIAFIGYYLMQQMIPNLIKALQAAHFLTH